MNANYFPAVRPDMLRDGYRLSPLHWLDPRARDAGAYHPQVLCSAYLWRDAAGVPANDGGLVFGDSGGYQLASVGADLNPRRVLVWQLRHAHRGPVLDVPPVEGKTVLPKDPEARFGYCLRVTEANLQAALPLYMQARAAGTRFRWWGVVHGSTWRELTEWHARLARIYPFAREGEGWCFSPDPQPTAVARVVAFARAEGIRRVHVFVPGGPAAVGTLLTLAAEAGIESLSWDNSSPITAGFTYRTLYRRKASGLGWRTVGERFRDTNGRDRRARDFMLAECPCPSCRWFAEDVKEAPRRASEEGYIRRRFAYHNVLVALDTYGTLKRQVRRDEADEKKSPEGGDG